eukprot:gene27813-34592_t
MAVSSMLLSNSVLNNSLLFTKELLSLKSIHLSRCWTERVSRLVAMIESASNLEAIHLLNSKHVRDSLVAKIARFCPKLNNVHFENLPSISDESVAALCQSCSSITSVHLLRCSIGDKAVLAVANNCPLLRTLRIPGGEMGNITVLSLNAIANRCRNLTALDLSHQRQIGRTALLLVLSRCRGIVELGLAAIKGDAVDNDFLYHPRKPCLVALLPRLTKLDISHNRLLTDSLSTLASRCVFMRDLRINYMNTDWIPISTFEAIARKMTRLQRIEFAPACSSRADVFALMFSHFWKVSVFDAVNYVLEGRPVPDRLLAVGLKVDQVRNDLKYSVTTEPSLWVANFIGDTHRCSRLSELAIRTPESLHQLDGFGRNLVQLGVLTFGIEVKVRDVVFVILAKHCRLLREVVVTAAELLSDQGVITLASHNEQLVKVHFVHAVHLTNVSVRALAKYCPRLRDMLLQDSKLVTDSSLATLAGRCAQLSAVDVRGCAQVTAAGVSHLVSLCPSLSVLRLKGCAVNSGEKDCQDGEERFSLAQRYEALM